MDSTPSRAELILLVICISNRSMMPSSTELALDELVGTPTVIRLQSRILAVSHMAGTLSTSVSRIRQMENFLLRSYLPTVILLSA